MIDTAFGETSRLNSRAMLDAVRNSGENRAGRYSVVVVLKMPPDGMRRAAFLISRRYDLSSVVRNRARRLFRESFRQLFSRLSGCWILFIPRRPMKKASLEPVKSELERMLGELGVLGGCTSSGHAEPEAGTVAPGNTCVTGE